MLYGHRPRQFLLIAIVLAAAQVRPAAAQVTSVSWTGAATGSWFTNTNWSGGTVPNNGAPVGSEYAVTIGGPTDVNVTLDSNATIDSLNLSAPNGVLSIAGTQLTVTNANSSGITIGTGDSIQVSSNGILALGGNVFTQGGGSITLGSGGSIRATADGQTLTNGSTINGAGNIGVNGSNLVLVNQAGGLIDANVSAGTLAIDPTGASSNAGTLRASNGGTLQLNGGTITNTGTITALDASTVNLNGITITAGAGNSFTTAGTGTILGSSVSLDGTANAVVNAGAFQVSSTTVMGTITNNGTITFATNGMLALGGNSTLNGSGTVTLANNGCSIRAGVATATLTNASTINGGSGNGIGVIGGILIVANQSTGLIDANISGANLALAPAAGSTNAGTFRASNGGTLTIQGNGSFTNTGTITALDASTINLNGITITGGAGNSFTTAGTGVILGTSVTLDGTTSAVVNSGSFQVGATTIKGGLTNNGTVSFGTNATLSLSDNTTITGSGTITLANNGSSIRASTTGLTLTNSSTINGGSSNGIGVFGNALVIANQSTGLFDANVANASLTLQPATGSTNADTLQASNGGTLTIEGGGITNTGTLPRSEPARRQFPPSA